MMALQTVGQHLENVMIPLTIQTVHLLLDHVRSGEDNECDLRRSEESNADLHMCSLAFRSMN